MFYFIYVSEKTTETELNAKKKGGGQVIMIFLALWEVHIGICYNIFCAFDIFKMFYNLTSL